MEYVRYGNGIRKEYDYHQPNEESLKKIEVLRGKFSDLHDALLGLTPQSREQSIAFTKLEELAMWAIKSVVKNQTL